MKILIISGEVWRDDTNGGNVLSNIFEGFNAEFAQVYCSPGLPSNKLCKSYLQITDKMVLNNILKKASVGKRMDYDDFPQNFYKDNQSEKEKKAYAIGRRFRFQSFYALKEIAWKISSWKSKELKEFILKFNPDVIFAPCYASHRMLRLDRYVKELTGKPMISYISDDNYSLKQFRFSLVFWINRLILRHNMRKAFPFYDFMYTMTQEQKNELQGILSCPIQILCKSADFSGEGQEKQINDPIKLIYAGGIYLNRWKILREIVKAMEILNQEGLKATLNIYTNNVLSEKQKKVLCVNNISFVHPAVCFAELEKIYRESDIAIHCESFSLRYKFETRLSFSTKIIDCLHSGCAVLAIAWKRQAGFKYLQEQDAAICIDSIKDIVPTVRKIFKEKEIISKYAKKAWECGKRNHQIEQIQRQLQKDFAELAGELS